jgi:hypothetical protein
MFLNSYSFKHKRLVKMLCRACLTALVFISFSAKAQYRYGGSDEDKFGAALTAGYDVPVGNLSYTYKPAITYGARFLWTKGAVTANISFGYHVYKPKLDTFYYAVDESNYGKVSYSNFTIYSFYIGGAYNLEVTDGFKIYGGLDLGAYESHVVVHSSDLYVDSHSDTHQEDVYLAPKLGFTYLVTENIGIGIEGKYNFFAPTGKAKDNPAVGTLYNSYSGNLVLTYNF